MKRQSAKAREQAAVHRVVEQFGAEVMVSIESPMPRSARERLGHRMAVDEQIMECEACGLREHAVAPLEPMWPNAVLDRPGRLAIVGEAPTYGEDEAGQLGVGRAWSTLQTLIRQAGIEADRLTYVNVVQCAPHAGDQRTTRPPTAAEANTCRPNLMAALDAADVDYVLLLGAHALRAWRPDLTLERTAGGLFVWQRRWFVTPLQHVNAVLRQDSAVEMREWRTSLDRACQYVLNGTGLEGLGRGCIGCGAGMFGWDEDGVPWCEEHFDQGRSGRAGQRRKPTGDPRQARLI